MDTVRAVILAANGSLVKASEAHGIQSERVYAREEDRRMWDGEGPGPEYKGVKRIIN
jgi:hypothetical protein